MNLNPVDFNYIDGENIYPLQDYIDEQINNLVSTNIYTSNIYITPTKKLNEVINYSTSNLNIQNDINFGQIQFKTSTSYPEDNTKYGTIIDFTGKLQVYHNYNILQPTFSAGYYDVETELLQLKADGINTDIQLTGLEATDIAQQGQIMNTNNQLITVEQRLFFLTESIFSNATYAQFSNLLSSCNFVQAQERYTSLRATLREDADTIYTNSYGRGLIFSAICGAAGAAIGATASFFAYQRASNMLYSNLNTTTTEKNTIYNAGLSDEIQSYSNFSISTSNLNVANGFINCNIITLQNIPIINSSQITVNNTGSATYSLINFSNATNNSSGYVGLGGIVSGYHNNNMIYKTPGAHVFNVPGQDSLSVPAFAINSFGNVGIGINPSAYPLYRFSVSGDIYIHTGGALRTNSIIYNGTELSTNIDNYLLKSGGTMTGLLTVPTINVTTSITTPSIIYNSQELSTTLNNYLLKSGGTMTGALTTNSIIYNSEELSTTLTNYLLKAGGTMNGRIVFNTGYYQNPSPTGFGDRIVLQTGIGTTGYNYSVGINTDVFWYSAPATASYKWYSGATNTATLNNVGLLTLPSINATTSITTPSIIYNGTELSTTVGNYLLKSGGTMTGQLAITANSASSLISLTNTGTVGQGILQTNNLGGFARLTYYNSGAGGYYTCNYVLEASSNNAAIVMNTGGNTSNSIPRFILNSSGNIGIGISNPSAKLEVNGKIGCIGTLNCWSNVGIGVTNPYTLLHVRGTNPALTIMGQGGGGATSTINLSTYDHTTNSTNCALVATDSGNFGATFQIRQKLAGADTNGLFTSFIMNVDGNVGIGTTTVAGIKFYVNGKTRFEDVVTYTTGAWNLSKDGVYRTHYGNNAASYYSCGNSTEAHYFMKDASRGYGPIAIMYNSGDIVTYGNITSGTNSYVYAGGLRIAGWDYNNSLYNGARDLGLTVDNGKSITFNIWGGNGTMMTVNNNNVVMNTLTRSRQYFNYGTTLDYRTSFDGTNGPGWYWITNGYWDGISTVSYLCIAITCLGQNAVWFGRMFLGQGGGFYQTICDMRNPNGGTNTIDVADVWNGGGGNAIKITINNAVYGGQFNIKVSG
jgi:hypothetical protein